MNIEETKLTIERILNAPPKKVFEAWTNPTILARWFAPGEMGITVHAADAKVGGQYEITMHGEEDHTCAGTYQIVTPQKIQMSFNWTGEPLPNDTTLAVTIEPHGDGTKLTLEHTGFPSQDATTNHHEGWSSCVEKLAALWA